MKEKITYVLMSMGLLFLCFIGSSEECTMSPFRVPMEINGWKLTRPEPDRYNAENLFDYIDGNAEVYRSLGVKVVWAYKWKNEREVEIILDIFDMGNSHSAYGAFHNDVRDQIDIGIGVESELMSNSLAFWKGRYFVSIVALEVSEEIKRTIIELGKIIELQILEKGEIPSIVSLLPNKGLKRSCVHYFRNYDLLKVHYYIADENILGLTMETEGILAKYVIEPAQDEFNIIIIKYPTEHEAKDRLQQLNKYFESLRDNSPNMEKTKIKTVLTSRKREYLFIILDWKDSSIAEKYLQQMIENTK